MQRRKRMTQQTLADSMLNQVFYLIRITGKLAYLWLLASQMYMLNRKRKAVLKT